MLTIKCPEFCPGKEMSSNLDSPPPPEEVSVYPFEGLLYKSLSPYQSCNNCLCHSELHKQKTKSGSEEAFFSFSLRVLGGEGGSISSL